MSSFSREEGHCPETGDKIVFLDIDGVMLPHDVFDSGYYGGDIPDVLDELQVLYGVDYRRLSRMYPSAVGKLYYGFNRESVSELKRILDTSGAKIVLSSDWRACGRDVMRDLFRIHGLDVYYVADTPDLYRWEGVSEEDRKAFRGRGADGLRTLEILEFVRRNPQVERYVALDDLDLVPGLEGHFVCTFETDRLVRSHADEAIRILSPPA
jgi:hypothetical protein